MPKNKHTNSLRSELSEEEIKNAMIEYIINLNIGHKAATAVAELHIQHVTVGQGISEYTGHVVKGWVTTNTPGSGEAN